MIGILSQGRMGNQMFQFAFIYATGKKLNTSYFIYNHNSLHYFKLEKDFEEKNRKNIFKFTLKNILKKSGIGFASETVKNLKWRLQDWGVNKNICVWDNTLDNNNYYLDKIKDNTFYKGYFQSEKYFITEAETIKKLFEIKSEYQKKILDSKKYLMDKKNIVVHIRRTDYVNNGEDYLGGKDLRLPASYYKNCLSKIKDNLQYNVIFVSDDIEFVKQEFGFSENYLYEKNDEITDFQILLNADILIMANSSFSWWAAWLNSKPNKTIYAPDYFLGFRVNQFYPAGIKVESWNWVDVN